MAGQSEAVDRAEQYLRTRLEDQRAYFARAASREQQRGKDWQNLVIASMALTPFLIGMSEIVGASTEAGTTLRAVALFSSFVLAVATTVLEVRTYWRNGVNYRSHEMALARERHLWEQRAGEYADAHDDDDARRLLVERVEAILAQDTIDWQARMRDASERLKSK